MRTLLITLIFSTIATLISAQSNKIVLSFNITTEVQDVSGFDKISVSEDFLVYIRFSDSSEKVEIEANENLHDLIQVRKQGSTLVIDTKSYSYSYSNHNGKTKGAPERLVAYITANKLTEITANEDVVVELEETLVSDDLTIRLAEDCILRGHINVDNLEVDLSEDCVLKITGSANVMSANAAEDCIIHGPDFTIDNLSINLDEDSQAKLTVNGNINLSANEDSYFYYTGNGQFTRKRLRGDSEAGKF